MEDLTEAGASSQGWGADAGKGARGAPSGQVTDALYLSVPATTPVRHDQGAPGSQPGIDEYCTAFVNRIDPLVARAEIRDAYRSR